MLTHFVPKVYFKCADKGNGIFQLRRYSQTLRLLQSSFKIEKFFWLHRCWSQIIKMFNIWCWRQVWDVGDTFFMSPIYFCHKHLKMVTIIKSPTSRPSCFLDTLTFLENFKSKWPHRFSLQEAWFIRYDSWLICQLAGLRFRSFRSWTHRSNLIRSGWKTLIHSQVYCVIKVIHPYEILTNHKRQSFIFFNLLSVYFFTSIRLK